jgi:hypothetical protein
MSLRNKKRKTSKRRGRYKSVLESKVARQLGRKAKYETEHIPYVLPKRYTPDFVLAKPNHGSDHDTGKVYIEVKGWLRSEDQQKMKSVKHCNPHLDIRFYFPNDGKVQGSSMKNSDWCRKYDFKYCIGTIPEDWLK